MNDKVAEYSGSTLTIFSQHILLAFIITDEKSICSPTVIPLCGMCGFSFGRGDVWFFSEVYFSLSLIFHSFYDESNVELFLFLLFRMCASSTWRLGSFLNSKILGFISSNSSPSLFSEFSSSEGNLVGPFLSEPVDTSCGRVLKAFILSSMLLSISYFPFLQLSVLWGDFFRPIFQFADELFSDIHLIMFPIYWVFIVITIIFIPRVSAHSFPNLPALVSHPPLPLESVSIFTMMSLPDRSVIGASWEVPYPSCCIGLLSSGSLFLHIWLWNQLQCESSPCAVLHLPWGVGTSLGSPWVSSLLGRFTC